MLARATLALSAALLVATFGALASAQAWNSATQTWTVTSQTEWDSVMFCLALGGYDVPPTSCDAYSGYDGTLAHTILLGNDLAVAGPGDLMGINLLEVGGGAAGPLTVDGQGFAIDGAATYRGIFVWSGTVTLTDLTIQNALARGGDGFAATLRPSGGGAGLGGALFIAPGVSVTLDNVDFTGNTARGGSGGIYGGTFSDAGGGGMGGNGDVLGGGGIGVLATGANQTPGIATGADPSFETGPHGGGNPFGGGGVSGGSLGGGALAAVAVTLVVAGQKVGSGEAADGSRLEGSEEEPTITQGSGEVLETGLAQEVGSERAGTCS